jgi:phosphopantothenoylcysteine decarboxylase / phosphopantothenate---cysteine ligase
MLAGKKILIGITGGIAAYKIPLLIRLLIRQGAEVKVVMTPEATDFVTPLTLSVLSQNPVAIEPFNASDGLWHSHIELGSWADAYLIAPLTANSMAKMASGITDNLLLATYLAARCPVFFAPSMDVDMYEHPTTRKNISTLQEFGNILISPQSGELASGLTGMGRLEEPEAIVSILGNYFSRPLPLSGKHLLICSGPTVEPIDPVRFISNHSTGKMGYAIAMEAAHRGARVSFVSGPVNEYPQHPGISVFPVKTAAEMNDCCQTIFPESDITIMAAAVADYRPARPYSEKLKKHDDTFSLELVKTTDILAGLGKIRKPDQILVGFALETGDEINHASAKLHTKNLDMIVLNSLQDQGAGFGFQTNKVSFLYPDGQQTDFELKSKAAVACDILDAVQKIHS